MSKTRTRGMSLIEVLIGMVLMIIVVLALFSLYNTGQKYFVNQNIKSDILNNNRVTLTWLSRDIKEAVQVIPGPIDIDGTSYSTSSGSIVLRLPSIDANGIIIDIDNEFDYLVYQVNPEDSTQIIRIVDGKDGVSSRVDGSRVLAENVSSLVLGFLDSNGVVVSDKSETAIVDIGLTSLKKGVQRTYQETINTQTKLRNKAIT